MPTTKQLFIGSTELVQNFPQAMRRRHLLVWLSGFVIINLPALRLTFGNFHSNDYSLLLASSYGILLNAFLFYGITYLILNQQSANSRQLLYQTLLLFGIVTLVESQLDAGYFYLFYGGITLSIYLDIFVGSILMNAIFFYLPAIVFGIVQRWRIEVPSSKIMIKDGQQEVYLDSEEVLLVESDRNYAIFHTTRGRLLQRTSLSRLEEELPRQFLRCHRSFIVNQHHIEKRKALELVVAGKCIPVGRKYKDNLN